MKVRLRIDTLTVEADWSRTDRAAFAEALQTALESELRRAGLAGQLRRAARTEPRERLSAPGLQLGVPAEAAARLGALLTDHIGAAPPAGGRR
jgi:hypothetical protein